MISEQEAREAWALLHAAMEMAAKFEDGPASDEKREIALDVKRHSFTLATFAVEELARRETERSERALPITEEWLKANGFQVEHDLAWHSDRVSVRQYADQVGDIAESTILLDDNEIIWRASRRQLLDLIAALKGGAS